MKSWWRSIILILLVLLPFLYFTSRSPEMQSSYPQLPELRAAREAGEEMRSESAEAARMLTIQTLEGRRERLAGSYVEQFRINGRIPGYARQKSLKEVEREINEMENREADWFWDVLTLFLLYQFFRMLFLFSTEFLFRGFLLNALRDKFGYYAVLVQMLPAVMLQSASPSLDLYYTVPGALIFGILAYHTRSIWPGFLCISGAMLMFDVFVMFL